jgi:hypothetical protein
MISNRKIVAGVIIAAVCILTMATAVLAASFSFSGVIADELEYDLYTVDLIAGDRVAATLICDEESPGSRPLDPVLTVFFPGSDPSNLGDFDEFNDDGYGLDDSPNGVDCDNFDSSVVVFNAPVTGTYTFRADGFDIRTGPYTLTIYVNVNLAEVLGGSGVTWFEPGDDRINRQAYAQAAIYCDADSSSIRILGINDKGEGFELLNIAYADLPATPTDANVVIGQNGNVTLYRLVTGEFQVSAGPDAEGKSYVAVWDACPWTYLNAYIEQNGVLTQTEANINAGG